MQPSGPRPGRSNDRRDVVVLAVLVALLVVVGSVSGLYDLFESTLHSNPYLDEMIATLVLSSVAVVTLWARRSRRAAAEHRLRAQAEARYRQLVEESPAVVYRWDTRAHAHTYVSPQIEPLLGYTAEEWGVDAWERAIHPEDRERVLEASGEADRTGSDFVAEYRVLTRDGRTVWLRDVSRPLEVDDDGHARISQGVIVDITAEREATRRAEEAEARFRTIVERVPAVAYSWDEAPPPGAPQIGYISPQLERLLGYRPDEWAADPDAWERAAHLEDRDRVLAEWDRAAAEGLPFVAEYRMRHADGRWRWVRDEANPVTDGDGPAHLYQGVIHDVTDRHESERLVRESEERWRTVLERLPVTTYMMEYDAEGSQTIRDRWVGPGAFALTGYTVQEWLADDDLWAKSLHPADRDRVEAAWAQAERSGGPYEAEYRMVRKDGATIWVHEETNVTLRQGRVRVDGVMTDVTERYEAEVAIRQAEARFRTLVEQLPAMIYIEDPRSGENLYISPQIVDILGFTPEEWKADPRLWERRLHPDDHDWVVEEDDAEGDTWSVDYRSIARDGRVVWLHNEALLVRDEEGAALYWQGVTYDITARKEAEELLREAEHRYRSLVEQLPVALYTDAVDELSTALYVSPRYEQLTGFSPAQRLEDPGLWARMLHPDDRDAVLAESARTNASGEPFDVEYRIIRADGTTAWLHDHAVLVDGPGGRPVWQGVLQDVTERRVAEDALSRRDAILQATGFAAERILRSSSWREGLQEILARLARAGGAERAGLWENRTDEEGALLTTLIASWNDDGHELDDETTQDFPWEEGGFGRWAELLGRGEVVQGVVDGLPDTERAYFAARDPQQRSVLAIPVLVEGEWWGYIGFDHRADTRIWHPSEIDAIVATAATLGAAIVRERAEERLSETQRRYRTLVEQIPAMTYVEDASSGDAIYVSPQAEAILGYGPDEWGGYDKWMACLHPEDRDRVLEIDDRTNRTGEPYHAEYRLLHRDGHPVWLRDEAVLVRDPEGRPLYWQGVRFDISAEKAAEEQLREAEERYRGIVEHVPAAIYLDRADRSMRSVYVSPQIEPITGITPDEWLADPEIWLKRMVPEDRDRVLGGYLAAAEAGTSWSDEFRLHTPDGRTVWLHDETTYLHDEHGRPAYLQGVIFDVTEQKLAEQALRESEQREREAADRLRALDEMKNTFLAAVSHELRSPLTSILGLSLTLERAPDMEEVDRGDLLRRLSSNARKLDRLLKDLLDIDRLNRGIVTPQYRTTDVGALARGVVEHLDALVGRDVVVEADPVLIAVDPPKIERIVENLLTNAVRHTERDRRIWLRVGPFDDGVVIAVEDDGPGVPAEIRDAVFEPFRQGPTASPHSPGTGIGLSLVARFAELHGGRAWIEDRAGGGASFRVFIPGAPPLEATASPLDDPAEDLSQTLGAG
ncbi:MAG: PAS domain-containing protein [Planctomycetaceae bacterium]